MAELIAAQNSAAAFFKVQLNYEPFGLLPHAAPHNKLILI
jgi:hypothetical protein